MDTAAWSPLSISTRSAAARILARNREPSPRRARVRGPVERVTRAAGRAIYATSSKFRQRAGNGTGEAFSPLRF
jgi:hypothetical protein